VLSNYSQNNVAFGVVAGSQKGKNVFGGGTGGGGIKADSGLPSDRLHDDRSLRLGIGSHA
jgi:hypothetical protein